MSMNFLERAIVGVTVGFAGMVFSGCDKVVEPNTDYCTFNDGTTHEVINLRENLFHENTVLKIGDYTFTREPKNGSLIETEGEKKQILHPGIPVPLPVQHDGREYGIDFSSGAKYIKAEINSKCADQSPQNP